MTLDNYEIKIEARRKGTHHKSGYCSDAYDYTDVDEPYNFTIPVPNKKFVEDYVASDGKIDTYSLSEYNRLHSIYSWETRICNGSGYCGCKVNVTLNNAKLVKKSNIKHMFLNDFSSDENATDVYAPKTVPMTAPKTSPKTVPMTAPKTSPKTVPMTAPKTTHKPPMMPVKKKLPTFYSNSYKIRCSRIPCKFHPNCKFRFSSERPCFFKH
jgi:hypothetical protein